MKEENLQVDIDESYLNLDSEEEEDDVDTEFNVNLSLNLSKLQRLSDFHFNVGDYVQDQKNIEVVRKKLIKAPPILHSIKPK